MAALHRRPLLLLLVLKVLEQRGERALIGRLRLFGRRVDESAPLAVLAVAGVPERVAHLRLVLGVPRLLPQFVPAVRELTLVPVLAEAPLLYLVAELGLVLVVGQRLDLHLRQAVLGVHRRQSVYLRHQLGHLKVVALEVCGVERLAGQSAYGRHGVDAAALRPRAHGRHRVEEQVVGAGGRRLVDELVGAEAFERVRVAGGFLNGQAGADGVQAGVGAGGGGGGAGNLHAEDVLLEHVGAAGGGLQGRLVGQLRVVEVVHEVGAQKVHQVHLQKKKFLRNVCLFVVTAKYSFDDIVNKLIFC